MAKKAAEANKGNEEASKNILDAMLGGYKDTQYGHLKPVPVIIPSGSLKLDSVIRIKTGTTLRMGGPAEVGKTSQSFLFARNYMETMPKAKTVYVNAEAKLPEELQDRTGMKFVWTGEDWEYGTVFVLESNVCETIGDMLVRLLKTAHEQGEHICIIIDSIDMLISVNDLDKKLTEGKAPAGVNKLTKDLFRKISHLVRGFNAFLIMITQYSATFQPDKYAKTPPSMMEGNNTHAINHQASYGLYYRPRNRGDYILEDEDSQPDPTKNKILGVNAKVEIRKSSTDNTGYTIEVPIKRGRVGNAIWNEKEVVDLAVAFGIVFKENKSWFAFDPNILKEAKDANVTLKEKINGMSQLYDYFETDKDGYKWVRTKVEQIIRLRSTLLSEDETTKHKEEASK